MSGSLTRRGLLGRGGAVAGGAALGGLAGAALTPAGAAAQDGDAPDADNVLLVVVNGIRSDSVGAFDGAFDDNEVADTPNIDDLAGDSLRFERAVVESTPAMPARRALLSGAKSFPYRDWLRTEPLAGVPGWSPIWTGQPLVAEVAAADGVETVWVTDNPLCSGPRYEDFVVRTQDASPDDFESPPPVPREGTIGREQTLREVESHLVPAIERCTEATRRAVQEGIRQLDRLGDGRFLLAIDPFDAAEAYAAPRSWTRSLELDPSLDSVVRNPEWIVSADVGDDAVAAAREAYMRGLEEVDSLVGELMAEVEGRGLFDNTAIFLISDGHTMLGEHGWIGRGAPGSYKHAYFTPYLIRDPKGRRSGHFSYYYASTQDFAPTALSLLGVDIPGQMDGEDLTALLDEEDPPKRSTFMCASATKIACGDPRWLMLTDMERSDIQLHDFDEDNDKDDDERENVVRKYPAVIEELWHGPLAAGQGTLPNFGADAPVRPDPEDDDLDDDGIKDNDERNDSRTGGDRGADSDDLDFDEARGQDVDVIDVDAIGRPPPPGPPQGR